MSHRTLASLVYGLVFMAAHLALAERAPNLLVILTDDQGYADVGFNGCKDIPTPHIDRIAKEGVRFTNGYVTFAVCGPSRAGLITGRYQDRFGACRNPTVNPAIPNNGVPLSEKNLAELLRPKGYMSMAVGKWHLGSHPALRPRVRGFDEFFGFLSGGHQYFPEDLTIERLEDVRRKWDWYRTKILRNETPIDTDNYLTDELSTAAVDFIGRAKDRPFFLYLAYNAPHGPLQATPKYLKRFEQIKDKKRRTYAAMVSAVDDGVGRVLAALEETGVDEHTLVVFLSDNGGPSSTGANNSPLRGHKGSPYEGGIRVPFAMRWPGRIPAGIDYEKPVSSLDIAATIVAHAEAEVADDKPLDGVDLLPYLSGEKTGRPHDQLFWRWADAKRYVIREGPRKLIIQDGKTDQLYDLSEDLGERKNLAANASLRSEVDTLRETVEDWATPMVAPIAPGLKSWTFGPRKTTDP